MTPAYHVTLHRASVMVRPVIVRPATPDLRAVKLRIIELLDGGVLTVHLHELHATAESAMQAALNFSSALLKNRCSPSAGVGAGESPVSAP